MKQLIATLISLVILFKPAFANGASTGLDYRNITAKDGLGNNLVECLIQDKEGYVWIGTKRGLCRYDGYEMITHRSELNDSMSLPYHHITSLCENTDNTLWVGLWNNGLCYYNKVDDCFTKVNLSQNDNFPPNITINEIHKDSQGYIWVAHSQGLQRISLKKTSKLEIKDISRFINQEVGSIYETSDKSLYVAQGKRLLKYFSPTHAFVEVSNLGDLIDGVINDIYAYDTQTLWLATDDGLYAVDVLSKEVHCLIKNNTFRFFIENDTEIWIGGGNLFTYNNDEQTFIKTNEVFSSQADNLMTCGIYDKQGNLWIGSSINGLAITSAQVSPFKYHEDLVGTIKKDITNITAIHIDNENHLYLGSENNGLVIIDDKQKKIDLKKSIAGLKSSLMKTGVIRYINESPDGEIWICGSQPHLIVIAPDNSSYKTYSYSGSSILFEQNKIWLAEGSTLQMFDPNNQNHIPYYHNGNGVSGLSSLKVDAQGKLWLSSYNDGLFYLDRNTKELIQAGDNYTNLPKKKGVCLFTDSKKNLWYGTEFYGLFVRLHQTDTFKHYTTDDGIATNDNCSIEEDRGGNLWIGTNHGLSLLDVKNGHFRNFFMEDGLVGDEFNYSASCFDDEGLLYFGSINGLVVFNPKDIYEDSTTLPIKITDISINNGNVLKDKNGVEIKHALHSQIPMVLKHNENTISFEFSTINFSASKKSQFAYQLQGLDDDYHYVNQRRQVTYTMLPLGQYTFKVMASNNDNVWNRNAASFSFIISRPPWKSWWAYLIYSTAIIGLILLALSIIRREQGLKNQVVIERIEKEQQDSLVKMKLGFFTNISHEFKTPLSLIISPLEELISQQHGNSTLKKKLTQISTNSKRLLMLVNQLIDFRKMEQDILPLHQDVFELVALCRQAMFLFNDKAEHRNIKFELITGIVESKIISDSDKIEKILNNILSNAFKYTPENGYIKIFLSLGEKEINFRIEDSGIGIPEEKVPYVFERFFSDEKTKEGSGIGMAYVKKMVGLLQGDIKLKSVIGQGTTLSISIPYSTPTLVNPEFQNTSASNCQDKSVPPRSTIKDKPKQSPKSDAPHLLVVEDDYELRKHICSILNDSYHTAEAENGAIAYEMISKNDYQLVISDVMMPEVDGMQLCAKIKSNLKTNHITVLLLTAKDDVDSEMEGYQIGADAYIKKPFSTSKLLSIVKNQLTTRQKVIAHYTASKSKNMPETIGASAQNQAFIDEINRFITLHISDPKFGITSLCKKTNLSRSSLYSRVKKTAGLSPKDYIRKIKLEKAADLLQNSQLTASEIAYDLGFNSSSNFFTAFKSFYGKTPKEFKKEENG